MYPILDEDYRKSLQTFFRKFPTIELDDLILRDIALRDVEDHLKLMSDPLVNNNLSDEDLPKNTADSLVEVRFLSSLFYRKQCVHWAIADKATDKMIGTICYNSWNFYNHRAEIAYELMPSYWRKGIMTRVLSTILTFGFTQMSLNRIEAKTMQHNIASQGLLEKMNFKKEGLIRNYRFIRGSYADICMYSLLKKDYNALLL